MLALARWDGPYSSTAFSLAKELAKSNRIFYIDNPITFRYFFLNFWKPQIRRRIKALFFGLNPYVRPDDHNSNFIAVTPRLTLPINFLSSGDFYNTLSAVNDSSLNRTLRQTVKDFAVTNFIFINCFNPFYVRKFPVGFIPRLFIYMTVDDIRYSTHIKKHGPQLEKEMMMKADIVLATSNELTALSGEVSKHTYYLPNAADITLFKDSIESDLPKPPEFLQLKNPIVIYTGNIDHRIDFELLNSIVNHNPELTFVFVGPVSIGDDSLVRLRTCHNVIFIGKRDIAELPAFLHHSHCAIIPFKCNALTKSIYPLKINEYLATGKPVVSTPFSADIMKFEDVIAICNEAKSFSSAIVASLESNSDEKVRARLNFVENNTWQARVKTFWEIANKYLN